jgi:hypothetical protein
MLDFKLNVYDNVLTEKQIMSIQEVLLSTEVPWHFNEKTVQLNDYETQKDNLTYEYLMFVHRFRDDQGNVISNYSGVTDYVLKKFVEHTQIQVKKSYRVKMNLQPKCDKVGYNTPHVDIVNKKHWVLIYYVCDSDGDTHIFQNNTEPTRIQPKAGRYVLFDGLLTHTGSHPNNHDKRVVINFNLDID